MTYIPEWKLDRDYLWLNERELMLKEIEDRQYLPIRGKDDCIVHVLPSRDEEGNLVRTEYYFEGGETRLPTRTERDVLNKLDVVETCVVEAFTKACHPTSERDLARLAEIQYSIEQALQVNDQERLDAAQKELVNEELLDIIYMEDMVVKL